MVKSIGFICFFKNNIYLCGMIKYRLMNIKL